MGQATTNSRTWSPDSRGRSEGRPEAVPKFATPRRPERPTFGGRIAKVARLLGWEPMPHQVDWFDVIGEYYIDDDSGVLIPFYREAFKTTPRQSGKSAELLSWSWDRGLSWGKPQRIGWTAQAATDARRKWIKEYYPQIEASAIEPAVKALVRANGNEAMEMRTGSGIDLLGSTMSSGHGGTYHGAVLDELFADTDWRREQMFIPAMSTVKDGQRIGCSTAGTAASVVLNTKVKQGRLAVSEGQDSGLAFCEFSAPDGWDEDDEESYFEFMPALGHTIDLEVVREAKRSLAPKPGEFRRGYGNISTGGSTESVLPVEMWSAVCDPSVRPAGKMGVGIDVSEDRSSASVAVADDRGVVEIVEHRPGTGWVVAVANEVSRRLGARVAFDKLGPASALSEDLTKDHGFGVPEVTDACGWFFDGVVDRKLRVRDSPELDDAVEGAVKKMIGDRFVWSRKASTTDPTPLIAATLAVWMAKQSGDEETNVW